MNFNSFIKSLSEISERRLMYLLITVILLVDVAILVLSNGFSGGSYSVMHYQYARWAFANPENFLNGWANPLFTLFAAPFSLLGFESMQLMNIMLGILAGYFAFLVAKELKMRSPLLALVICSFTPVFMITFFGGTTEVMFAFVAILGTYLLVKKRFVAGALVISLLPLIRLDGLVLLPVYAIYFIRWRKTKFLPLLLSGFVGYSLLGMLFGKGIFWLFDGVSFWSKSAYGSGSLFQYIVRSPGYFGIPNEIFFVTGLVAGLWLFIRERREYSQEFVLVVLPFVVYFLAHSLAWWLGIFNSQGVSRYMAAIVPFMAVMATRGLYLFAKMFYIIFKREWVRVAALVLGFASIIHIPFVLQNYPVGLSSTDRAMLEAARFIGGSEYATRNVYFTDPSVLYFLDRKPSCELCRPFSSISQVDAMSPGDLLVYESAFGITKGIELDSLLFNRSLKLIRTFDADVPTLTFGRLYRVVIFERVNPDTALVAQNLSVFSGFGKSYRTLAFLNFDGKGQVEDESLVSTSKINSSAYLRIPKKNKKFLESTFQLNRPDVFNPIELRVTFRLFSKTSDEKLKYFVRAKSGKTEIEKIFEVHAPVNANPDEWNEISFTVLLPELDGASEVQIDTGFWNKRKGEFLVDDYKVEVRVM